MQSAYSESPLPGIFAQKIIIMNLFPHHQLSQRATFLCKKLYSHRVCRCLYILKDDWISGEWSYNYNGLGASKYLQHHTPSPMWLHLIPRWERRHSLNRKHSGVYFLWTVTSQFFCSFFSLYYLIQEWHLVKFCSIYAITVGMVHSLVPEIETNKTASAPKWLEMTLETLLQSTDLIFRNVFWEQRRGRDWLCFCFWTI